jgi:hypothetical protein
MLDTHAKGLTMAEKQEIVLGGAKMAEAVESLLERGYKATIKMVKVIDDGHGAQMVGHLEANELRNEARSIAGAQADALARFYRLHKRLTEIAIKNDADVPQPRGGGTR